MLNLKRPATRLLTSLIVVTLAATVGRAQPPQNAPIRFEDVTEKLGIRAHLKNWELGHGAAWGDVDNDGRADLYFGAFADRPLWSEPNPPNPNMLLLNKPGGFVLSNQPELIRQGLHERNSNDVFVDLNNDGHLDLVMGAHGTGEKQTLLFQNTGGGKFRNVTPVSEVGKPVVWPTNFPTRNTVPIDLNHDGLLDLIFCDGGYDPSPHNPRWRLLALQNKGNFQFEDVSEKYGFTPVPESFGRMSCEQGLAMGDVNDDGTPDIFVAGSNRLFVSNAQGIYHEVQTGYFTRPPRRGDALACGAAFGDLNGDGRLDLVTTLHGQPSRIYIYLNSGVQDGEVRFEQVTREAGLGDTFPSFGTGDPGSGYEATRPRSREGRLPLKNTHVAIRDVDNDGKMDIMLALTFRDERGQIQPLVLKNQGNGQTGIPTFWRPANESLVGYYAAAPITDYDDDGRLDIYMCNWFTGDAQSYLFRNVSEGGRWLQVKVEGRGKGFNPMGIGATVRVYETGHAGDAKFLLARQDIAIGTGYASGDEAFAYFGLGNRENCDVEVSWAGRTVRRSNVPTNQLLTIAVTSS